LKVTVEEPKLGEANSHNIKLYKELQEQFVKNRNDRFYDYLLKKRMLNKDMIDMFELGYNNRFFYSKKNEPTIAKDSITIPFRDFRGRIVAFQSRFIDVLKINGQEFRYFFTHNLPFVYQRSKYIYNLNNVLTNHYNRVAILVEGVFDLISLYQLGIHNVISPLQNRLTLEQTEVLRRYFDKLYFLMDKGESGEVILSKNNLRLYELNLLKIQVKDIDGVELKDANDMLKAGIDIRAFMKKNKQVVENPNVGGGD